VPELIAASTGLGPGRHLGLVAVGIANGGPLLGAGAKREEDPCFVLVVSVGR
jgi:hypothetical protein